MKLQGRSPRDFLCAHEAQCAHGIPTCVFFIGGKRIMEQPVVTVVPVKNIVTPVTPGWHIKIIHTKVLLTKVKYSNIISL